MRSPGIAIVVFAVVLALLTLPLVGQIPSERVDLDAIYKIKDEGLNRSQVMGAVAISTLSGATLILDAQRSPLLQSMLPFLRGFTLFFWATGTWWIPMLVILGLWRHV